MSLAITLVLLFPAHHVLGFALLLLFDDIFGVLLAYLNSELCKFLRALTGEKNPDKDTRLNARRKVWHDGDRRAKTVYLVNNTKSAIGHCSIHQTSTRYRSPIHRSRRTLSTTIISQLCLFYIVATISHILSSLFVVLFLGLVVVAFEWWLWPMMIVVPVSLVVLATIASSLVWYAFV